MRFDTSQHMKLGQHMKLAPRMIQSMEILQMPLNELEERIEQELESNVTLEVTEQEGDARLVKEEVRDTEREASENERPLKVDEQHGEIAVPQGLGTEVDEFDVERVGRRSGEVRVAGPQLGAEGREAFGDHDRR